MSIASEITRIQSAKASLKAAIEAKGVAVPSSATIDTYATYVSQIIAIEPQYRTTSGVPYCQGYDKYVDVYSQVSNDSGQTWTTTATTPTLVESESEECGYVPTPEEEWIEMDDNTFDLSSPIYKVKMNAQDIYDTYGIDAFTVAWGDLNDDVYGMGTPYELDYNVQLVDDHLEVSIAVLENYEQVTSFTFDLSSEEVIIDFNALFGKPLYAGSCNMLCVDGDDENCNSYAPLWSASVSEGT